VQTSTRNISIRQVSSDAATLQSGAAAPLLLSLLRATAAAVGAAVYSEVYD